MKYILSLSVLLFAFSFFYYLVIYIPQRDTAKLEREKIESQEALRAYQINFDDCKQIVTASAKNLVQNNPGFFQEYDVQSYLETKQNECMKYRGF